MKKILSLALAAAMVMSALPVAYAAENETDHSNGTEITYIGSQEEAAGGAGDVWTVTVPAKMVPGDTGTVKAEGMWAAHKALNVIAPKSVTLTYGAQTMDVAITCNNGSNVPSTAHNGFYLIGNSVDSVSKEATISVEDATRLFGTWNGTIVYTVELVEKGDINRDGVIDLEDYNLLCQGINDYDSLSPEQQALVDTYGDMNGDSKITVADRIPLSMMLQENGFVIE